MPPWVIDLVMTILILGMTYALVSEGLWGAALVFFNVLFSALITFNFYEPCAEMLAGAAPGIAGWADMLCLMGIFLVSLILTKIITESIAPAMVRFPAPIYNLGRIVFGLAGGAITAAVLLLAFETAPVNKKVFGVVDYKYQPPWGLGLDRKWLAFFQWTTGYPFARYGSEVNDSEFQDTYVFDRRGSWLIDHQNARPHGEGRVPEPEVAGAADAGGGEGGGGAPGNAPAGGPAPGNAGGDRAPRIPGGQAGAAVGLAPM